MSLKTAVVIFLAGVVSSLLLLAAAFKFAETSKQAQAYQAQQRELRYYKEAAFIAENLYQEGTPVSTLIIEETLEQIDLQLPKFFPAGPYTREDFIAMAWLESSFNKFEIGTHGEKGIFQIMPDEYNDFDVRTNKYDVAVNTRLCMSVLRGKFKQWPDYKKAVIAYNGVVITKSGRWSEKYWKAFEKRRATIHAVFDNTPKQ